MPRVLHVLTQRPSLTGSGITLDAVVRRAASAGWVQHVVVGIPAGESTPRVGGLPATDVSPLNFESGRLTFPVPGMSDVMPYRSTRFSRMTAEQLSAYRGEWRAHLTRVVEEFRPQVIHSHHLWIVSAMLEDLAPETSIVTQCHSTGLRQLQLCPHLANEVRRGCARNDRFLALHGGDAREIARQLQVADDRVVVVGAGYRDDLFHTRGRTPVAPARVAYVGKLSVAKGLPWLLDAVEQLGAVRPELELHVVGSGSGVESDGLVRRMRAMSVVKHHGALSQEDLGDLLRRCRVFVLPSFYEGVPLVIVEALACGCHPVATDLPGVRDELAPHLGSVLRRVPLPRMTGIDTPDPRDLPAFVEELRRAIDSALEEPVDPPHAPASLERFTWSAVFERIEAVWRSLTS